MRPAERMRERASQTLGRPLGPEVTEKRTPTSKTFQLGDREYHLSKRLRPIHYQDDSGKWQEIDLAIEASFRLEKAPYKLRLLPAGKVGYRYTSRKNGGWMEMELVSLDGQPVGSVQRRRDGDKVRWTLAPNVSMYLQALPDHPEIFKVYGSAPHTTVWRVTDSGDFPGQFNPRTRGTDAAGDNLEILATYEAGVFTETWTGRVSRIADPRKRKKAWFDDPAFPVLVDATITEGIGAGEDDVFYRKQNDPPGGTFSTSVAEMSVVNYNVGGTFTSRGYAGVRFRTVGVPVGATVSSAILTIRVTQVDNTPDAKFYFDDVDDAALWADAAGNRPNNITKTTASTTFSPTTTGIKAIDVTTGVVEVVARAGWAENNNMRGAFFPQAEAAGQLHRFFVEGLESIAGTDEAQLDITYTEGAPEPTEPEYPPVAGSVPLQQATQGLVNEEFQLAHLANRLNGQGLPAAPVSAETSLERIRALYPQLLVSPGRGRSRIYADLTNILTGEEVGTQTPVETMLATLHRSLDAYDAQ